MSYIKDFSGANTPKLKLLYKTEDHHFVLCTTILLDAIILRHSQSRFLACIFTVLPIRSMKLILFNKPFDVMCQFSPHPTRATLANYIKTPNIYPAGRLDADSEGLVLLTDDGKLQHKISHPNWKEAKTYLVQVEGNANSEQLTRLANPLDLGDFITLPCKAVKIAEPEWIWPRTPVIRERANIPTSWLCIVLSEGKNRQVRRMTAAVGLPTLRLIRSGIGDYNLATHPLLPGEAMEIST